METTPHSGTNLTLRQHYIQVWISPWDNTTLQCGAKPEHLTLRNRFNGFQIHHWGNR